MNKNADEAKDGGARQLMGIKGATETTNKWAIRLQLCKPVTWIPLIWGVACGAAASGNYHTWNPFGSGDVPLSLVTEDAAKALACMVLSGPILTGYTQTLNDWEDRAIDAINEPYRPIPSGKITEQEVVTQIWALWLSGLGLAFGLDHWAGNDDLTILKLTVFGTFIAYIYSAPPLKLKATGWAGSFALGSSYISLPWLCGQAMFGELSWPVTVLTVFYSLAGLGIAIVNDFKSIEGDRALGLQSLPVAFGIDAAKWLTVGTIDLTQLAVAGYLAYIGETTYALVLLGLIAPQVFFQFKYFLPDPVANDVKYQASAQPFLVFGILATALAVGHHGPL
jgi:chlorophyll synthase